MASADFVSSSAVSAYAQTWSLSRASSAACRSIEATAAVFCAQERRLFPGERRSRQAGQHGQTREPNNQTFQHGVSTHLYRQLATSDPGGAVRSMCFVIRLNSSRSRGPQQCGAPRW